MNNPQPVNVENDVFKGKYMFMHKVTKPNQLGPCVRILPKDVVIKIDIGGV